MNGLDLAVINTTSTNNVVVATIAKTGTSGGMNAIATLAKSEVPVEKAILDYVFTLPGVAEPQVTAIRLTAKLKASSGELSKLYFPFFGGEGDVTAGAAFFDGTVKQTGKVYP